MYTDIPPRSHWDWATLARETAQPTERGYNFVFTRHMQKTLTTEEQTEIWTLLKLMIPFHQKKSKSNNNKNQENINRMKGKSKIGRTCL